MLSKVIPVHLYDLMAVNNGRVSYWDGYLIGTQIITGVYGGALNSLNMLSWLPYKLNVYIVASVIVFTGVSSATGLGTACHRDRSTFI